MKESSSSKTEQPTQKKLRDARKKGQVAKSQDVGSTFILIAIFAVFFAGFHSMFRRTCAMVAEATNYYQSDFSEALVLLGNRLFNDALMLLLPVIGLAVLAGIMGNIFQTGFVFSPEAIKPDINKLNPAEGLKKIFSKKSFFEFFKNILKTLLLGLLVYLTLDWLIIDILRLPYTGLPGVLQILGPVMNVFCWLVALGAIAFAAADFFFQKFIFTKEMMMTKDEVKREYKETEGSPEIKQKRRQLALEIANSNKIEHTRKATVLVTNPTHFAIALHYDKDEKKLPRVVAKGEGEIALRMIDVAREENIPIMRDVPLAHALYDQVNEEHYIPDNLIEAVVKVLKWVEETRP